MPMSSDPKTSMFPTFTFNYTYEQERCMKSYGVKPRGRWITTEFGGHVRCLLISYEFACYIILFYVYISFHLCFVVIPFVLSEEIFDFHLIRDTRSFREDLLKPRY